MAARVAPPLEVARRTSLAEYYKLAELGLYRGQRVELVGGIVVRMAPIGPPHASAVQRLITWLVRGIKDDQGVVRGQLPLHAGDDTEPEPDVAVVPPGRYADRHPDRALLVIEVAESSLSYDRETKAPLYAASRVEEYWIVDLAGGAIEVYTEPKDGRYTRTRRVVPGEKLSAAALPGVVVDVAELLRA